MGKKTDVVNLKRALSGSEDDEGNPLLSSTPKSDKEG